MSNEPTQRTGWPRGPSPQVVAERVRTLELQVTHKLDSLLHGAHEGLTPGHGSELGESRPYLPGDEVRRIDWNVTARTNVVHVRDMIAERELTTWLVVDLDANMDFGTTGTSKANLAAASVATIGFINQRDANRIAAVLLNGSQQRLFGPQPGRDHVRAILTAALESQGLDGTGHSDLSAALHTVMATQHHRGMIVLISDLRGGPGGRSLEGLDPRLRDDLARATLQHEVLVVQIVDQRDMEFPDVGVINLVDPATGETREVMATSALAEAYQARTRAWQQQVTHDIRSAGADHLVLSTGEDWLTTIARHVKQRRHRMRLFRR